MYCYKYTTQFLVRIALALMFIIFWSVLSTHMIAHTVCNSNFKGSICSSGLHRHKAHMWYTFRESTQTHRIK